MWYNMMLNTHVYLHLAFTSCPGHGTAQYVFTAFVCSINKAVGHGQFEPFGLFFLFFQSDCLSCPRPPEPEPPRKVRVWTSDNLHLRKHIVTVVGYSWSDLEFEQCSKIPLAIIWSQRLTESCKRSDDSCW